MKSKENQLLEKCEEECKKYTPLLNQMCVIGELYFRIEKLEAEVKLLKEEVYL